jgi:glutaredoxin 3
MAKVMVYTTTYCPYCVRAKDLLKRRGIPYEEVQLSEEDDKAWDDLYQRSKMQTVPQIFADGEIIGGYTELAALDQRDQLASLADKK